MSRLAEQLLRRVLMVTPKHYNIEYKINPWMGGAIDENRAFEQWKSLKSAIEKEGVEVLTMDQVAGLSDQVFVCHSGLILNNRVYLSRFRHRERCDEEPHYRKWFKSLGLHVFGDDYPEFFEGGCDAVFSDSKTLWAGYGPRSDRQVYEKLRVLGGFDIVICELVHPNFYHLDTCFTPVNQTTALWYPPAFSERSKKEIMRRLPRSVAVSEAEANAFVCNSIAIRNTVLAPIGVTKTTREALALRQLNVTELDMSEFIKGGGACQSLVLRL
ncbi:unnamed protein product [Haemonchus placei]|uniref:Amidinotransferase n=1 Tax=Haemonchus placei TaxID=6290 RepID=A0A0N4WRT8_HAEPC|nr:unnamed protein product [Haemonchus placei]